MISVVILTKNNEKTIHKVLESVKSFSEVILLDTGSTDSTIDIAQKFPNVSIKNNDWTSFGGMRNLGATYASNDWVLALDSDERLSPSLAKEILSLKFQEDVVYDLPFHNYYNDKHIKWCGWHPESHVRIYNKQKTSFSDSLVHEKLITKNLLTKRLKNPVFHHSYSTTDDFLTKMQLYSTLFAKQYKHKKKSSFSIALFHGVGAFIKSYFLKKGVFGGKEGFVISLYNANTAFYKYLKLMEENLR